MDRLRFYLAIQRLNVDRLWDALLNAPREPVNYINMIKLRQNVD